MIVISCYLERKNCSFDILYEYFLLLLNNIVCIGVSTPFQKHHPFFLVKPPLNPQTA